MPTQGKSLYAFLNAPDYEQLVTNTCVLPDPNNKSQILANWVAAQGRLGQAVANAGNPDIQPIPASHTAYIQSLRQAQWVVERGLALWNYALVEIEPLLAYQYTIALPRSQHHCTPFAQPPTLDQLLTACLPLVPPSDTFSVTHAPNSMLITSKSLNLQGLAYGMVAQGFAGLVFGPSVPFAHVTRYNGRCYLHNGFHRAYGAKLAGATHIPCVLRDVLTPEEAGIRTDGGTFGLSVLESANPPTMAHFTRGSAEDVQLRVFTRSLHVSWAQYSVAEE